MSRARTCLGLGLLMAALSIEAAADVPLTTTPDMSPVYRQCLDAAASEGRDRCLAAEYTLQDARLNRAYKQLIAGLDDGARTALRGEERQWIVERDRACGEGEAKVNACSLARTASRADTLELRIGFEPISFERVKGRWAYADDCDYRHRAHVEVLQDGQTLSGRWSDGGTSFGAGGALQGRLVDGRMHVRLCDEVGGDDAYPACPAFHSEDDGVLQLQNGKLVWLQTGDAPGTFSRYLVLQREPETVVACPQ